MRGIAITSAITNSHCIVLTSFLTSSGGKGGIMELSRRDFLHHYPFPYLQFQITTQQTKLASAVIPISNLKNLGVNTYLCQFRIR